MTNQGFEDVDDEDVDDEDEENENEEEEKKAVFVGQAVPTPSPWALKRPEGLALLPQFGR